MCMCVCGVGGGGSVCVLGGKYGVCVCVLGEDGSRAANVEGGEWAGWYSNLSHLSEATSAFVGQTTTFQKTHIKILV